MPLTLDISNFNESVDSQTGVSGAQTLNLADHNNFSLVLSGDVDISVSNPSADPSGNSFTVALEQDGTGGHSVTSWPSGTKWTDGSAPTVDGTANTVTVVTFVSFDGGSTWIGMVAALGAE